MPSSQNLRRPLFLGDSRPVTTTPARFASTGAMGGGPAHAAPHASAPPPVEPPSAPVREAPRGIDPRVTSAIAALQAQVSQLAEAARSDALEIGLMIARRVLESELRADVAPLLALIKSAVRKAGESRRVRVHLCPEDMERVELAKVRSDVSVAHLELVADPELAPGDCLVDTDWGTVDGRLNARLAEIGKTLHAVRLGEVG